jgi:hypothetical protein
MEPELQSQVARLLEESRESARHGERDKAYQSSLRATSMAPDEPLAWYLRSRAAASTEERLMCLSRAVSLDPELPQAREDLRQAVKDLTSRDPFLGYVNETPDLYQVRSGADLLLNIPKNRLFEIPYPKRQPGPTNKVARWLVLAIFGLILGGFGAFLLAPIAGFRAMSLMGHASSRADRVRAGVIVILSLLVWLASIPITWLLIIRFLP